MTSIDSGLFRKATSNESGYYTVPLLHPGSYRITVEAEGFRPTVVPKVVLEVNQAIQQDFVLELGRVIESIEVGAEAELIQASTAELGTVISEQAVLDLPLNGRNFTQLLTLNPGASPANVSQNAGGGRATSVGEEAYPAINGQSNRSNIFLTDGALNQATMYSTYAVPPIVDAIQEFKVQSHNDLAEFGLATGGIVNVVTKSGTNTLHGTAWWFHRNDNLDARDFFRPNVTPLVQNMYGGTVGGPVKKNKSFYFLAYQGYKNRTPANRLYRVPTEANLKGDMSDWQQQIYDPFSTRLDPQARTGMTRDPFPENRIPVSRFDKGYLDFLRRTVPAPIQTGVADRNQLDLSPTAEDMHEYNARLDHKFSDQDMIWGRLSGQFFDRDGSGGRQAITAYNDIETRNLAANWLHTFSPNSMFNLQFSYGLHIEDSGTAFRQLPKSYSQETGFNPVFTRFRTGAHVFPNIGVDQFFSGGESRERSKLSETYTWTSSHSKIVGNHQLKFGGEFTNWDFSVVASSLDVTFNNVGTSDPNNQARTGSPLTSFLLDVPDSAQKKDFFKIPRFGGVWGFYAQDSWKAFSKLTVNYGIRYDRTILPPIGRHSDLGIYHGTWNFADGTYVIQAKPGTCAELGAAPCIPSKDGSLPPRVVVDPREKLLHDSTDNWQPRVGLAYRLTPKTVIRTSFGVFFDNFAGISQMAQNNGHTWPDVARLLASAVNRPTTAALLPSLSGKNPFPHAAMPEATPNQRQAWFADPYWKNAYSMQWNFGFQRQLTSTSDLSVNYVGSGNRRQPLALFYNVALTPGPGDPAKRRPYPDVAPNNWQTSWGRSNYNSLQLQMRKRFSGGFSVLTNYTWAKSIDIGCSGWFNEGASIQDPYHFNNDRSVSGHDLTHILNVSWTYELPWSARRPLPGNRFLTAVFGDWQINGIARFTSGQPYTITMNGDIPNTGMANGTLRPNVRYDATLDNPAPERWFDSGAFFAPQPYNFGNAGRNILRRDGMNNFDLSLFKKIPMNFIREGIRMELRLEAFNAFNTPQFAAPVANLSNSNFGRVLGTAVSPRQIQVGTKIVF